MKKRNMIKSKVVLGMLMVASALFITACGAEKQAEKREEAAEPATNQLKEQVDTMQDDYKHYVENMGIDVDAAMEEAGR